MSAMTKGQVESRISEAIIKFEKDYMGRGPTETKAYIIKDMVLVRLKGVLTPAEEQLAKSPEGADLIRKPGCASWKAPGFCLRQWWLKSPDARCRACIPISALRPGNG